MLLVPRLLWLIPLLGLCVLPKSSLAFAEEEQQGDDLFTERIEVKNTETDFLSTIFDTATPRINHNNLNLENNDTIKNNAHEKIDTDDIEPTTENFDNLYDTIGDYQNSENAENDTGDYPANFENETNANALSVKDMLEGEGNKTDEGFNKVFKVIRDWIKESKETTKGEESKEIDIKNVPLNGLIENAQIFETNEEADEFSTVSNLEETTVFDEIADKENNPSFQNVAEFTTISEEDQSEVVTTSSVETVDDEDVMKAIEKFEEDVEKVIEDFKNEIETTTMPQVDNLLKNNIIKSHKLETSTFLNDNKNVNLDSSVVNEKDGDMTSEDLVTDKNSLNEEENVPENSNIQEITQSEDVEGQSTSISNDDVEELKNDGWEVVDNEDLQEEYSRVLKDSNLVASEEKPNLTTESIQNEGYMSPEEILENSSYDDKAIEVQRPSEKFVEKNQQPQDEVEDSSENHDLVASEEKPNLTAENIQNEGNTSPEEILENSSHDDKAIEVQSPNEKFVEEENQQPEDEVEDSSDNDDGNTIGEVQSTTQIDLEEVNQQLLDDIEDIKHEIAKEAVTQELADDMISLHESDKTTIATEVENIAQTATEEETAQMLAQEGTENISVADVTMPKLVQETTISVEDESTQDPEAELTSNNSSNSAEETKTEEAENEKSTDVEATKLIHAEENSGLSQKEVITEASLIGANEVFSEDSVITSADMGELIEETSNADDDISEHTEEITKTNDDKTVNTDDNTRKEIKEASTQDKRNLPVQETEEQTKEDVSENETENADDTQNDIEEEATIAEESTDIPNKVFFEESSTDKGELIEEIPNADDDISEHTEEITETNDDKTVNTDEDTRKEIEEELTQDERNLPVQETEEQTKEDVSENETENADDTQKALEEEATIAEESTDIPNKVFSEESSTDKGELIEEISNADDDISEHTEEITETNDDKTVNTDEDTRKEIEEELTQDERNLPVQETEEQTEDVSENETENADGDTQKEIEEKGTIAEESTDIPLQQVKQISDQSVSERETTISSENSDVESETNISSETSNVESETTISSENSDTDPSQRFSEEEIEPKIRKDKEETSDDDIKEHIDGLTNKKEIVEDTTTNIEEDTDKTTSEDKINNTPTEEIKEEAIKEIDTAISTHTNEALESKKEPTVSSQADLEETETAHSIQNNEAVQPTPGSLSQTEDQETTTQHFEILEDNNRSSKNLKPILADSFLAPENIKDTHMKATSSVSEKIVTEETVSSTTKFEGFNEEDEEIIEGLEKEILMDKIEEDILGEEIEKLVLDKVEKEDSNDDSKPKINEENRVERLFPEKQDITENIDITTTINDEEVNEVVTEDVITGDKNDEEGKTKENQESNIVEQTTLSKTSNDYEEELELVEHAVEEAAQDLETNIDEITKDGSNKVAEQETTTSSSNTEQAKFEYEKSTTYISPYEIIVTDEVISHEESTTQTPTPPTTTESYGVFNFFKNIYGIVRGTASTENPDVEVVKAEEETPAVPEEIKEEPELENVATTTLISIAEYIHEKTTLPSITDENTDNDVKPTTIAEYVTSHSSSSEDQTTIAEYVTSYSSSSEDQTSVFSDFNENNNIEEEEDTDDFEEDKMIEIIKNAATEEIKLSEEDDENYNLSENSEDSLGDLSHFNDGSNELIQETDEQVEDGFTTSKNDPNLDMNEERIVEESQNVEIKADFEPIIKETKSEINQENVNINLESTTLVNEVENKEEETPHKAESNISDKENSEKELKNQNREDEESNQNKEDEEESTQNEDDGQEIHKNLFNVKEHEETDESLQNNKEQSITVTTDAPKRKYHDDEDYEVISKLIEAFDVISTNEVKDDELTSEDINKLHKDVEDLGDTQSNVEEDVEEIDAILKTKKIPNANKYSGSSRIVGSIYNDYGDACLNLNLTARININNTIVTVPPNAIVKGNCSNSEVHVKISWRSISDKNANNSIYFVMKVEGTHYFISYVHLNLLDQHNKGKKEHEILDLQALTSDGMTVNKTENMSFKDDDVTLELIEANLKVQEYFGSLGGSVTLAYGNAFILQIASGCVCVLMVLVALGFYMYKKTRSKERVFNVNEK